MFTRGVINCNFKKLCLSVIFIWTNIKEKWSMTQRLVSGKFNLLQAALPYSLGHDYC